MPFSIDPDHPCLAGHFPGRPVVPGVVVLEHVLEAIEAANGPVGAVRLPQVKFLRPLLPGQMAEIEIDTASPDHWRFRVRHGGELVASGDVARGSGA
jgi:3-hydroxymyristoyl/3-hydroxydecanoyl-(acyl carrier protein) dehydratase